MNRTPSLAFILIACVAGYSVPLIAEVIPPAGQKDARVRTVAYDADQVYRLRGFVGFHIHLEFAPDETFVGLGGGDIDALGFEADGASLFIKPRSATVATNLTIKTSKRLYHLEYSARARKPDPTVDDVIYAVRFVYPEDAHAAAADPKRVAAALDQSSKPENFNYWFCGDPALKPTLAYDDGKQTHFRFLPNTEWPAVFVATGDDESLTNFHIEKGELVVHRIAQRFHLRRGKVVGCIVNQGFSGGSERSDTETIAPNVERHVKGTAP